MSERTNDVSYIIVSRNPNNNKLRVVTDDDYPAEYATEDEAFAVAQTIPMCRAWGAEIVPIARAAKAQEPKS